MEKQRDNRMRQQGADGTRATVRPSLAPVLVVDDEPLIRMALVDIVTDAGFPVVEADDGAVALELLRKGLRPSLILIDLSMSRMDGRAFRKEQTKDPTLREITTVVLTGSRVDLQALSRELGGVRVMAKPVDYDDLLALLDRHCAKAA